MTLLLRKTLFMIAKIKKRIHSTKRIPLNRSKQAHPFPINRGARLHSVLRNVWGIEHCPRECWRAFKARVILGCTTSEDKVCLCRVTHALARWHTLLGTGMAASRPSLCFYSPHFSILHFTHTSLTLQRSCTISQRLSYHRCCRIVPSYAKPKVGVRIGRANTAHRYHCKQYK